MSKLAVVILNWNGKRFLERFLPTLLRTLPDYAEAVVCDNASDDDSIAFLKEHFPQVTLLMNERNEGFARGYNLALQRVEAKYYCLLNSDIEVTDGWIEPVIEQMDANEKIAAVQPKLRSFDRRDEFEYAGASGGYIDKFGYPFCRGRVFGHVEKDHGQYDAVTDIFWATGAAMFVRSDVYHLMEGLDGDFFAHMEEIDFCWRIKNLGYKIKVNPASVVYHIGGGTLPKNNSYKTFLNFRNSLYLLIKNLPDERIRKTLIIRFFLDQVAAFSFLAQGHVKDFAAVYKALYTVARTHKRFLAKRNTFPKLAFQDCYPESVVKLHYLKRKTKFDGKSFS
jgi:hypothetical protein